MSEFADKVICLEDKSVLAVYGLFLVHISRLKKTSDSDITLISNLKKEVKSLFLNHEKCLEAMSFRIKQILRQHKRPISKHVKSYIDDVLDGLSSDALRECVASSDITPKKLNMEFARRFESEVSTQLLCHPSQTMLQEVSLISQKIIRLLQQLDSSFLYDHLLRGLGPHSNGSKLPFYDFAVGRFKHRPSLRDVIAVLTDNEDLPRIMLIHFIFMRNIVSVARFSASFEMQVCQTKFSGDLGRAQASGSVFSFAEISNFFCDYIGHAPHLYTDRGRKKFVPKGTRQLGLMLNSQSAKGLPCLNTAWAPDCLSNVVDIKSKYVKQLVCDYQIPYVAGPSGMTSLFMGLYAFLGDMSDVSGINYYILAVMAFIVGGGLHSIHEVLTVPVVRLGLLPKYQVEGAQAGNYGDFFQLFHHDQQVIKSIKLSWSNLFNFIEEQYPLLSKPTLQRSAENLRMGQNATTNCTIL